MRSPNRAPFYWIPDWIPDWIGLDYGDNCYHLIAIDYKRYLCGEAGINGYVTIESSTRREDSNMSKTVTIPSDVTRMEIHINEEVYIYAGGSTVTVPDDVAALLEMNAENNIAPLPVPVDIKAAGGYTGNDYVAVYMLADGTLCIKKADILAMNELPDDPSTDGTYTLQAVVDEGEVTLSWEAVEAETEPADIEGEK